MRSTVLEFRHIVVGNRILYGGSFAVVREIDESAIEGDRKFVLAFDDGQVLSISEDLSGKVARIDARDDDPQLEDIVEGTTLTLGGTVFTLEEHYAYGYDFRGDDSYGLDLTAPQLKELLERGVYVELPEKK